MAIPDLIDTVDVVSFIDKWVMFLINHILSYAIAEKGVPSSDFSNDVFTDIGVCLVFAKKSIGYFIIFYILFMSSKSGYIYSCDLL